MKKPKKSTINSMLDGASTLIFEAVINKRDKEWHRKASQWWMQYASISNDSAKKQ